jgi:hypothetical protein
MTYQDDVDSLIDPAGPDGPRSARIIKHIHVTRPNAALRQIAPSLTALTNAMGGKADASVVSDLLTRLAAVEAAIESLPTRASTPYVIEQIASGDSVSSRPPESVVPNGLAHYWVYDEPFVSPTGPVDMLSEDKVWNKGDLWSDFPASP